VGEVGIGRAVVAGLLAKVAGGGVEVLETRINYQYIPKK
jgi:hypothetical protein